MTTPKEGAEHSEFVDHGENASPWKCLLENPKIVLWTLYANRGSDFFDSHVSFSANPQMLTRKVGSTLVGYENLALSVCLSMPAFQYVSSSAIHSSDMPK